MAGVCDRTPRGSGKILRRHEGGTGIVFHGWFGRALIGWTPKGGWTAVVVKVDGNQVAVLDDVKRGPFWIDVLPGPHQLEFLTSGRSLRSTELIEQEGQAMLAAFRPPSRRRTEEWCFRPL